MEELAKSKNTPGTDAAFDVLKRIAVDPSADDRYPDGCMLIPADAPDSSESLSRAIEERRPVALVFADGSDFVARPPDAKGLGLFVLVVAIWLTDLATRKRDRPTFVPREWVTEFHAAPERRERELVA